jgi:N-acetylated-alpha-linked acidic dipeptidase
MLDEHLYTLASDPTQAYVPPERTSPVPFLNLAPLDNAVLRLDQSTRAYQSAFERVAKSDFTISQAQAARLNDCLQGLEEKLLRSEGLPGRPWYQHMIYAPGMKTGYGAKTLPGVREAIEGRRWAEAERCAAMTALALDAYSEGLDRAAAALGSSSGTAVP